MQHTIQGNMYIFRGNVYIKCINISVNSKDFSWGLLTQIQDSGYFWGRWEEEGVLGLGEDKCNDIFVTFYSFTKTEAIE